MEDSAIRHSSSVKSQSSFGVDVFWKSDLSCGKEGVEDCHKIGQKVASIDDLLSDGNQRLGDYLTAVRLAVLKSVESGGSDPFKSLSVV